MFSLSIKRIGIALFINCYFNFCDVTILTGINNSTANARIVTKTETHNLVMLRTAGHQVIGQHQNTLWPKPIGN